MTRLAYWPRDARLPSPLALVVTPHIFVKSMFSRFVQRAGLRATRRFSTQTTAPSTPSSWNRFLIAAGVAAGAGALWYESEEASASFGYVEECLPPPSYPWGHKSIFKSYDHAAIRRGYEVYKTIGIACHSMKYLHYRQLVDVAYTEDEMKEIAAEYDGYLTEPDDEGEVEERTGEVADLFWVPYPNEKAARAANNGAYPPDLSQIVRARVGGEDYIYALLTGYRDPPHGVDLGENMYYNLYFPGNQLAMPPPLADESVDYEDYPDIEPTMSQLCKDVTVYLAWSAYMEQDERHLMGIKTLGTILAFLPFVTYWKKWRWGYIKHRDVRFLKK